MRYRWSRRDVLLRCAAAGTLRAAPGLGLAAAVESMEAQEAAMKKPTPWNEIGPFYKRAAPHNAQLRTANDPGLPLRVNGTVYDTRGEILTGVTIEIWHADHHGIYDLDGYRFRTCLNADTAGKYAFDSIMPGHYPARVCQHVHYLVSVQGHKPLVTQLYFATDPVFDGDPDRNFGRDPLVMSRELVRPVMLEGDPQAIEASVRFDVVLERL